jgi:hypothetical protein
MLGLEHCLRALAQLARPDRAAGPLMARRADASTVMDDLDRLAALPDRRILTDAEFEAQKAHLLTS